MTCSAPAKRFTPPACRPSSPTAWCRASRRPGAATLGLLHCLLLACFGPACQPALPQLQLGAIAIDLPTAAPASEAAATAALRQGIVAHLQQQAGLSLVEAATSPARLQVQCSDLPRPSLQLRLQQAAHLPTLQVQVGLLGTTAAPQSCLQAFAPAWQELAVRRQLAASSDADLLAQLPPAAAAGAAQHRADADAYAASAQSSRRLFVVELLGHRRQRAAVPQLCRLLAQEDDLLLILRTIGALVAIGDSRAVLPLIDLAQNKEAAFVSQVVFAIGAIGGRTAEAYLVTVASGHADPQVQASAAEALRRLPMPATKAPST